MLQVRLHKKVDSLKPGSDSCYSRLLPILVELFQTTATKSTNQAHSGPSTRPRRTPSQRGCHQQLRIDSPATSLRMEAVARNLLPGVKSDLPLRASPCPGNSRRCPVLMNGERGGQPQPVENGEPVGVPSIQVPKWVGWGT